MSHKPKILNFEQTGQYNKRSFGLDVLDGLSNTPKTLPPKYLYDEKGSWLFEKITEQPEYYLTKSEFEILNKRKNDISQIVGKAPFRLIELGVGDARKTKVLLDFFIKCGLDFEYVLVDCCQEIVEQAVASLQASFKENFVKVLGIVAVHSAALEWLKNSGSVKNVVLFLGSSIGNFEHKESEIFLHEMWNALNDKDCVYLGFDLKKDVDILQKAYNDKAGYTREFNLNLLDRMNRELEANFNRDFFRHHSFYNPKLGRMESWLLSTHAQTVTIGKLQKAFHFDPWEGIHVESSYKYDLSYINTLAESGGFVVQNTLVDSKEYLADVIWEVKKLPVQETVGGKCN